MFACVRVCACVCDHFSDTRACASARVSQNQLVGTFYTAAYVILLCFSAVGGGFAAFWVVRRASVVGLRAISVHSATCVCCTESETRHCGEQSERKLFEIN